MRVVVWGINYAPEITGIAPHNVALCEFLNARGDAAYQTGHGAARDIAGKDVVNPMGQILSLGMMLRESFDWPEADFILRKALRATLREGVTTRDIAMPGFKILGTRAFASEIKKNLASLLVGRTI